MINRFEITGNCLLLRFFDFLFHALDDLLHLHLFLSPRVEPIDAGDVGAVIKRNAGSSRRNFATSTRMLIVDQKRRLLRWTGVRDDVDLARRQPLLRSRALICSSDSIIESDIDLRLALQHSVAAFVISSQLRQLKQFRIRSAAPRSCAPNAGTGNSLG